MIKTYTVSAGDLILRLTSGDRSGDYNLLIVSPRRESVDGAELIDYAQISVYDRKLLEEIRDFLNKHLKDLKAI